MQVNHQCSRPIRFDIEMVHCHRVVAWCSVVLILQWALTLATPLAVVCVAVSIPGI